MGADVRAQTAMGGGHFSEIPAGDDFVGLTRAFLYAGSEAVMATLWEDGPVAEEVAASLADLGGTVRRLAVPEGLVSW